MAILAECPTCHKKQSAKNKRCKCGENLDKAKKSKRVRYWISYRLPNGKQRRESVASFENLNPYSIEDARDAEGKRKVQRREKRIFEMLPETHMTFSELAEWYFGLKSVQRLATYETVQWAINAFNKTFGNELVSTLRPLDLENFQDQLEEKGAVPATIDYILIRVGVMVRKAWDNDMVDGRIVKAFKRVKNKLVTGSNARERTLTLDGYLRILNSASTHLKPMVIMAFHTGMRQGELLKLEWYTLTVKMVLSGYRRRSQRKGNPRAFLSITMSKRYWIACREHFTMTLFSPIMVGYRGEDQKCFQRCM